MYDEDRQRALDLYSSIFDGVGNETAVLQLLSSPTRQAVNLARVYDAKERKQQMAAGYLDEEPAFVRTILDLQSQAEALGLSAPHVDDNQLSLFDEPDAAEAVFADLELAPADEEDPASPPLDLPVSEHFFPDEDPQGDPQPPAPETAPVQAPVSAQTWVQPPVQQDEPAPADVEAFLADFSLPDEAAPVRAGSDAAQSASGAEAREERRPSVSVHGASLRREQAKTGYAERPFPPGLAPAPRRRPRIALLILFLLAAVPLTLLCIGLLLIPAALALSAAAAGLAFGIWGLVSAFSAFSVFADILVVFGLSLVTEAVGLLFLWLFIWLLFGVIPALVRAVCTLARSWCYKEVEA